MNNNKKHLFYTLLKIITNNYLTIFKIIFIKIQEFHLNTLLYNIYFVTTTINYLMIDKEDQCLLLILLL